MNLVSSESGQAIQPFSMDEVRPVRGGPFWPDVITEITRHYRFVSFPKEFVPGKSARFETGVAVVGSVQIAVNVLEIYDDGVMVTAVNTDDADLVIDEFMHWARTTFQFREPKSRSPRIYFSRVVVELDEGLRVFFKNYDLCGTILAQSMNTNRPMHVARLAFAADATPQSTTSWQIEARVNVPFEVNRYFSAAPLSTNAHLNMLDALEAAMK